MIIRSYYHTIILSPDHNTKWLKSFSVPSPGFRHILSRLPLLQGSLPKNKGSSGNNFLRRICQRGSKIHSSSKTPLFWKIIDSEKVLQFFFSKSFLPNNCRNFGRLTGNRPNNVVDPSGHIESFSKKSSINNSHSLFRNPKKSALAQKPQKRQFSNFLEYSRKNVADRKVWNLSFLTHKKSFKNLF